MEKEPWSGLERGTPVCGSCGAALGGGEATYAALYADGEGFRRRDYCASCFEALPERPFSFWKRSGAALARNGGEEAREARREARRHDLDALVDLFERLGGPGAAEKGPDADKLRYLLALALVRKRRLHLVELARAGGADCLVLRASGEAEVVTVPAPALSKEELDRLAAGLENEVGLA